MSVNSEMTAIADLIRGLRGVSGKMGLDAMKGHLQDEQDGLDSALAALTEKGVTVPDGTKVDGLSALIAAIEAGGGSGGVTYAKGTITPAADMPCPITIEHNLGEIPSMFLFFRYGYASGNFKKKWDIVQTVIFKNPEKYIASTTDDGGFWNLNGNFGFNTGTSSSHWANSSKKNNFSFASSSYTLKAGNTYVWYAILGVT